MKIEITDQEAIIDGVKYVKESAAEKPRGLEPDRLYYFWDNYENERYRKSAARSGEGISSGGWDHIEPVNRRWDELREDEKVFFRRYLERHFLAAVSLGDARRSYKVFYKTITGEEHP